MNSSLTANPVPAERVYVRTRDVTELFDIDRAKLHELSKIPGFPKPLKLGHRTLRWRLKDVQKWIEKQGTKEGHQHGKS